VEEAEDRGGRTGRQHLPGLRERIGAHLPKWYTEVHHIVPRVHGGGDHPSNLKTLCVECHRKYTDEMLLSRIERTDEAYQAAKLFKKGRKRPER
jgi:5-methylcytosine-specific restriction protein A